MFVAAVMRQRVLLTRFAQFAQKRKEKAIDYVREIAD